MNTRTAARRAARSPWLALLARVGFLSRALTYAVVAVLAARVATAQADADESVGRKGALEAIAAQPLGHALLVLLAAGFAGYAAWRLGRAAFPPAEERKHVGRRWAHLGGGAAYLGVLALTVRLLFAGAHDRDGDPTRTLMALPAGPWLVGAVGVGLLASGAWSVKRALAEDYRKNLRRMPHRAQAWADLSAKGGLFARATGHLLIGGFLVRAAWDRDASESVGLDGALRAVAESPAGRVFLLAVALGYLARATFSVFEARYRKGT